jgi:hypothetical protein
VKYRCTLQPGQRAPPRGVPRQSAKSSTICDACSRPGVSLAGLPPSAWASAAPSSRSLLHTIQLHLGFGSLDYHHHLGRNEQHPQRPRQQRGQRALSTWPGCGQRALSPWPGCGQRALCPWPGCGWRSWLGCGWGCAWRASGSGWGSCCGCGAGCGCRRCAAASGSCCGWPSARASGNGCATASGPCSSKAGGQRRG